MRCVRMCYWLTSGDFAGERGQSHPTIALLTALRPWHVLKPPAPISPMGGTRGAGGSPTQQNHLPRAFAAQPHRYITGLGQKRMAFVDDREVRCAASDMQRERLAVSLETQHGLAAAPLVPLTTAAPAACPRRH
jgi:hypothetical protein